MKDLPEAEKGGEELKHDDELLGGLLAAALEADAPDEVVELLEEAAEFAAAAADLDEGVEDDLSEAVALEERLCDLEGEGVCQVEEEKEGQLHPRRRWRNMRA